MTLPRHVGVSLTSSLERGQRVFVAGLSSESALLREELMQNPEKAADVEFTCVQLPGIDSTDYLAFHPESRTRAFFMTPSVREGMRRSRTLLHPLDYSGIASHLWAADPFDCAIGQFTPPDRNGWCHPGMSVDFLPLVWKRAKRRIGHLNPRLPRIASSFRVHISELDVAVERDAPLLTVSNPEPTAAAQLIAALAANLILDGDTLQFGIGSVMPALAQALSSHRSLRIHSGMVSSFVETMWRSGSLSPDELIVAGVVFGDEAFYKSAGVLERLKLEDVRTTHGLGTVSAIERFVAINGAVEVDLFGQTNSERSDGSLMAGAGGLPAFAQATQLSHDSQFLICLPSTARNGKVSRIVPSLGAHGLCTVPRHLAGTIITEYGVAKLRDLSMEERAGALISIAHPDHRPSLSTAWEVIRRKL